MVHFDTAKTTFLFASVLALSVFSGRQPLAARPKPATTQALQVKDINGAPVRPLAAAAHAATVFFFIAHDCPMSNEYAPEINRIRADYARGIVAFYIVYTESDMTQQSAKKYAAQRNYTCPVLLDTAHKLVRQVGATVTPETAVLGAKGQLLYRGRIDDRYADYGNMRHSPSVLNLRATLDNILSGKPVIPSRTKVFGCFIAGT